jgi:hypothetical protein
MLKEKALTVIFLLQQRGQLKPPADACQLMMLRRLKVGLLPTNQTGMKKDSPVTEIYPAKEVQEDETSGDVS